MNSRRKKLEMKLEYEKKSEEFKKGKQGEPNGSHAKLPKLSITKFDGTFEQWLPFWNKFCAEIDSTDLPLVTKFAYLKELIQPKVRADIDGLPFSTEGYERAKNILKSEYGKTSEIINAYATSWVYQLSWTETRKKLICSTKSFCTMFKVWRR